MVQLFNWLKSLFRREIRVIEFNRAKLNEEMHNLSSNLAAFKDEASWKIVREVIELAKNIQILDVNHYADQERIWMHRGRLQALNDLGTYIDQAIESAKEPKDKRRGAVQTIRRTTNQAGSAI